MGDKGVTCSDVPIRDPGPTAVPVVRFAAHAAAVVALAACQVLGLDSSPVQYVEDVALSEPARSAYLEDANRLALRIILDEDGAASREVELPSDKVNELLTVLARVYHATELPARDSVVGRYQIHTRPPPELRRFGLLVDSLHPRFQPWRQGHRFTGDAHIDSLLLAYDLDVLKYSDLTYFQDEVMLQSGRALNLWALAPRFLEIEGVLEWEPIPTMGGDGNDITARRDGDRWTLEYSLGFGDCYAGCINRHYWTFRVYPNGRVEFAGSRGPPPPAPR